MNYNHISQKVKIFHGRTAPEEGVLVGYGALMERFNLSVPLPDILSLISFKNRKYNERNWQVFTARHQPEDTLFKHLVFALKYEGVNLLLLKILFENLSEKDAIKLFQEEPTGQYSKRLWFLYEWLLNKELPIEDLTIGNYVNAVDSSLQYSIPKGEKTSRFRVMNNLPGTIDFCPLIRKTEKLENYFSADFSSQNSKYLKEIRKDVLQRASAFMLLKDSKASFSIEGESPKSKRAARWGQAIGQAGVNELTKEELVRLQQVVIESSRFTKMGFREKGGFIGDHDRLTGEPLPDHISAKWSDLNQLMNGLTDTNKLFINNKFDAVLAAASVAFGFVFIHPFFDGNGRIHRYLIHHLLATKKFTPQGIVFPVSAAILNNIVDYRNVLESYSHPVLGFIKWEITKDNNVEVINDTIDYYRYFDATQVAEFLYKCVEETIEIIIPNEVSYLTKYDEFKRILDDEFEMPDKIVALLVRFLEQNEGRLSNRAKENDFDNLTDSEVKQIEELFLSIMQTN
ncbi:cell filamentation protein Fic [Brumimicrobium glaciale]|uniref:Cell filamentation protein Fic n=1 Tax=Brumimicrobium glaciale TaxID=200475 RepID=A0A4Q4KPQ3_9FLAO|nr:Fic family protein [Brumimicrobium glaciale]RYM33989.1 cell filamentation protein Fic [Brumimicrobium glaciale]